MNDREVMDIIDNTGWANRNGIPAPRQLVSGGRNGCKWAALLAFGLIVLTAIAGGLVSCDKPGNEPEPGTKQPTTLNFDISSMSDLSRHLPEIKTKTDGKDTAAVNFKQNIAEESANFTALGEFALLMERRNVLVNWNGKYIYPERDIVLTRRELEILCKLEFGVGPNGQRFRINPGDRDIPTVAQMANLGLANAQTITVQNGTNVDAVVAEAQELVKNNQSAVINFVDASGKITMSAKELGKFRSIALNPGVAFTQDPGTTITVNVNENQTSAYLLNTRALMPLTQSWVLNIGKNAAALGGVNNIVGYGDNCLGLDTVFYQTKFPGINQIGTPIYDASGTPVLGHWSNSRKCAVTLDGRPTTKSVRAAAMDKFQVGPNGDNSYLKMCAIYNVVNGDKDTPVDFIYMNMTCANVEILPDKAYMTEFIDGPTLNLKGEDLLYGEIGAPYFRRVFHGSNNDTSNDAMTAGKMNIILHGNADVGFEPGKNWFGGHTFEASIENLRKGLEVDGIKVTVPKGSLVYPLNFFDTGERTNRNTVPLDFSGVDFAKVH